MLELIAYYADRILKVLNSINENLTDISNGLGDEHNLSPGVHLSLISRYLKEKTEADRGRQIIVIDVNGGKNEREQKESE